MAIFFYVLAACKYHFLNFVILGTERSEIYAALFFVKKTMSYFLTRYLTFFENTVRIVLNQLTEYLFFLGGLDHGNKN